MDQRFAARLTPREGRKFALTMAVAFGGLGWVLVWRGHAAVATAVLGIAAAFAVAGIVVPGRLGPVFRGWMAFAIMLSRVTTPVFMGIIYYLLVAPIGFLRRRLAGDPLEHAADGGSYWVPRSRTGGRGGMENQF